MTNKEKTLYRLNSARTAHVRWMNSIKLLISGISVDTESIELTPTESQFGQWYYNEAVLFLQNKPRMVLEDIELILIALHDKYMKIYPIYTKKKKFLDNLLGSKSRVNDHETELSHRYYEELVVLSDKLKQKLRILENQLISLDESHFSVLSVILDESQKHTADRTFMMEENQEKAYFYGTRGR